jgi:hypothetical protein
MDSCPFCSQDSAGNHQPHCVNYPKKSQTAFGQFLDILGTDKQIDARPFDSLIEKYMGLMSAYMMTMDMIEVVGDMFGEKRLQAVASYILDELDECIETIVKLEEKKNGDRDDQE